MCPSFLVLAFFTLSAHSLPKGLPTFTADERATLAAEDGTEKNSLLTQQERHELREYHQIAHKQEKTLDALKRDEVNDLSAEIDSLNAMVSLDGMPQGRALAKFLSHIHSLELQRKHLLHPVTPAPTKAPTPVPSPAPTPLLINGKRPPSTALLVLENLVPTPPPAAGIVPPRRTRRKNTHARHGKQAMDYNYWDRYFMRQQRFARRTKPGNIPAPTPAPTTQQQWCLSVVSAWSRWSGCDTLCDTGRQTRTRSFKSDNAGRGAAARCSGLRLHQTAFCNLFSCDSQIEDSWHLSQHHKGPHIMAPRSPITIGFRGKMPCARRQTVSKWTKCNSECGPGLQLRWRRYSDCVGQRVLVRTQLEHQDCKVSDCIVGEAALPGGTANVSPRLPSLSSFMQAVEEQEEGTWAHGNRRWMNEVARHNDRDHDT